MGKNVTLTAKDGHKLGAYIAEPAGKAKGGVVVIQEIFGVNKHVRSLADYFASKGYLAVAPALFDRVEKGLDLGYDEKAFAKGRETRMKLTDPQILADVDAAAKEAGKAGKVGLIGYCFGGYVAWISGCNLSSLACSVSCYGGGVAARAANDKPKMPIQLHFGDRDHAIPLDDVQKVKNAHKDLGVFVYDDSAHGFCCDDRDVYNKGSCERAHGRALAFFAKNVG
jgi:carboxymethylenebutenolidase